jgi:hypothetical protein
LGKKNTTDDLLLNNKNALIRKYYQKIEILFDTDVNGIKEGCGIKIYP